MQKNPLNETIKDYEKQHGGAESAVLSLCRKYYLYPDGAYRDVNPEGMRYELRFINCPGNNKEEHSWKILQHRITYYETKKEWAVRDFEKLRNAMMNTDYSTEQWAELERLQKVVDAMADELEEVLNEEAEHPIYKRQQANKEYQAKSAQKIKDKNSQLDKMRI